MVLYWLIWTSVRLYFFGWLRVRVEGLENVPAHGAAIVCVNHRSWADPLLVGGVFPRRLYYMAKQEMFSAFPFFHVILRTVGAFPVQRHKADRKALRKAMALLAAGRLVAVFPEGTRSKSGEVGKAEPGAALLAVWSHKEVLPVGISGPYRRGQLVVRVGKPIVLTTEALRGKDLQVMADDQIMGAVRRLVEGPTLPARAAAGRS